MGELLAGLDPPEELKIPPEFIEAHTAFVLGTYVSISEADDPDPDQMEAMAQPIGTPESARAAAEWGFVFHRDFFLEDPISAYGIGYVALTAAADCLLNTRTVRIAMHSSPVS